MMPFSEHVRSAIHFAAELLQKSDFTAVLTGAGISTPSGIPDFRSEGTGLWANADSMEVASLNAFRYTPERFYEWIRPLAERIVKAQPNPAHLALGRLEQAGCIDRIITQNIDNLHQKAGSKNIVEMHGTLRTLSCSQCFKQVSSNGYLDSFLTRGEIPRCVECGAVMKPDVILFGEQLPIQAWQEALRVSRRCKLMIVAGSSLEVMPVAGLPLEVVERGAHLIIINHSPTYIAVRADLVILEDVAEVIPAIAERVLDARS